MVITALPSDVHFSMAIAFQTWWRSKGEQLFCTSPCPLVPSFMGLVLSTAGFQPPHALIPMEEQGWGPRLDCSALFSLVLFFFSLFFFPEVKPGFIQRY